MAGSDGGTMSCSPNGHRWRDYYRRGIARGVRHRNQPSLQLRPRRLDDGLVHRIFFPHEGGESPTSISS